jgi:hypothetical protein
VSCSSEFITSWSESMISTSWRMALMRQVGSKETELKRPMSYSLYISFSFSYIVMAGISRISFLIRDISSELINLHNEEYYFFFILFSNFKISRVSLTGFLLMMDSMRALKSSVLKLNAYLNAYSLRLRASRSFLSPLKLIIFSIFILLLFY